MVVSRSHKAVFFVLLIFHCLISCHGFAVTRGGATVTTTTLTSGLMPRPRRLQQRACLRLANSNKGFGKKEEGDRVRASTGIRPSLHPIVINAVAYALKQRSLKALGKSSVEEDLHFQVDPENNIQSIDVALTAGTFSAKFLGQRQDKDSDDEKLTEHEEQTVAGRIMGVIMRLDQLEMQLNERVGSVSWVAEYSEWSAFGVVENEHSDSSNCEIHETIVDNPLLALNRAECLLGIFLKEVEIPQLSKVGESVPDKSKIDFLDVDRMEVLGLM